MARRRRRNPALETTAEVVGRTLGHFAARWAELDRQRAELAADLTRLAKSMVGDAQPLAAGKALFQQLKRGKGGRPKGYKMSEATKRKLRAAWKRRKAAAKQS